MINNIFFYLERIDEFFWNYIGFTIILISGIYFSFSSKFFQIKALYKIRKNIKETIITDKENHGIHPLKLYFASIGGNVGLGNIVGIGLAVFVGGPGSIFWMWIASLFGMLLKYGEIYLGIKYRTKNKRNEYNGGALYYLQAAFPNAIAYIAAVLLCIYGVEVYQFTVIVHTLEHGLSLNKILVISILIIATLYISIGGIKRLSNVCSAMMPGFMIIYIIACLYIVCINYTAIPDTLSLIFKSAFNGHDPIGTFKGAGVGLIIYMGMSKAVYSGDIAIGYDSIVQSETRLSKPELQAKFAIYSLFTDTFICTLTSLIIVITKSWYTMDEVASSDVMANILGNYFPYSNAFMMLLLFFAGFTTITAYMTVGLKCANYLSNKYGKAIYICYAIIAFFAFSYIDQDKVIIIMSVSGGLLVLINTLGILALRKQVIFK